jgi:hypothetical protein
MLRFRFRLSMPKFVAVFCLIFFCGAAVFAQEPTPQPPPPQQPPASDTKTRQSTDQPDSSNDDASSLEHPVVVTSTTPPIRQVGAAGFLMPPMSPLRWGPFYVGYAQFAEILSEGSSSVGQENFQVVASQISASIVFDKEFRKARIALQYVPRMTILNGQVLGDYLNQDTGADMVFTLTPRLTMDMGDRFTYYRSKNSFADIFLSADPVSSTTLQSDFIEAPASWLSNSVNASFSYAVSARTRFSIAPNYLYATTSGAATSTTSSSVNEFGVNAGLTHDLTASSGLTATYTEQTDTVGGSSYRTIFQSLQGGYYHSFKGGWSFSGSFGFITANFQTGRDWSESGSGSVVKSFRRSRVAVAYLRGHEFSGYISQQFSDRIDASYQLFIGRRWTMGGGVGYLRDVATANGIWGKYGEANLSYGLTSTVSLFGSYVYKWQDANNTLVFSGTTNYLRCGIQWTPHRPVAR